MQSSGTLLVRGSLIQGNIQGLAFHCPSLPADLAPDSVDSGSRRSKIINDLFLRLSLIHLKAYHLIKLPEGRNIP